MKLRFWRMCLAALILSHSVAYAGALNPLQLGRTLLPVDQAEALKYLDRAVSDNATAAEAAYLRGVAHLASNNHPAALADFQTLVRLSPASPEAHLCLGNAYLMVVPSDYTRAIEEYGRAVQIDPRFSPAYINRGFAVYRKASEPILNDPVMAALVGWEGELPAEVLEEVQGAIRDFDKAISLGTNLFPAYYNKGVVLGFMFQDKQRCDALAKAIAQKPVYLPVDLVSFGFTGESRSGYLSGGEPLYLISGTYSYLMENHLTLNLSDLAQARDVGTYLKFVSSKDDLLAFAYYQRGVGLAKASVRDYGGAVRDLTRAVELNPDVYIFYQFRALANLGNGGSAESVRDSEKAQSVADGLVRRIDQADRDQIGRMLYGKTEEELKRLWGDPSTFTTVTDRGGATTRTLVFHFLKADGVDVLDKYIHASMSPSGPLTLVSDPYAAEVLRNYCVFDVTVRGNRVVGIRRVR